MFIGQIFIYSYIYFFVIYYIVFFITLIYYIIIEEWFCKNRIPMWYERAHRYVALQQRDEDTVEEI
jgi:hypothetical protein